MRDLGDELLRAEVDARLFGGDHSPRLGRLVILGRIGSGAMGTVYAAYDARLDRRVAVKVLDPELADVTERWLAEARALGRVAHPNVVAIYDADERDGIVHVVMELATGVPLRAWISDGRDWRAIVRVMREVAAGLAAAHAAGLVHRDVKPDNILIGADRARIIDFGLAADRAAAAAGVEVAGTPRYMAPEVLAGEPATAASDQFGFGVTLYEALHGVRPHDGASRDELREASRRAAGAATVRPIPSWLQAVVKRTLAAAPADRFPSMNAVVAALGYDRRRRRRRAIAIASGIALAIGAAGGVAVYRAGSGPDRCDAGGRLAGVWDAAATSRVAAALGDAPWKATEVAMMSAHADRWRASFGVVCRASRDGYQSDRLLELRMRCLDRSLARFGALVAALSQPIDPRTRAAAASATAELPDPAACEAMTEPGELALPTDPTRRAQALAAEHDLDAAWAEYGLGHYREAADRIAVIEPAIARVEAPGVRAAVLALAAAIATRTGKSEDARAALTRALAAAAAVHAADLELTLWSRILRHELFAGEPANVVEWEPFARAAAARAGRDGAELDGIVGEALRATGDLGRARALLQRAIESRDPLRGDQRALLYLNLGAIALAEGDPTAARAVLIRAHDLARTALGDGHPTLALYLDKLAEADRARGRLREALAGHDASIALRRTVFGDRDRSVATARFHHGETLIDAGQLAAATRELETARAIRVEAYGGDSPRLGEIDAALGDAARARGDRAGARSLYDRAGRLDPRLDLAARRHAAGAAVALDALPETVEPLTVDRAAALATRVMLTAPDRRAAVRDALVARWRATPSIDGRVSLAIAEMLRATGDRDGALAACERGLTDLAEPSLPRLRLLALRARLAPGGSSAAALATEARALPEVAPDG